jgi:HEAT repeat protein
MVGYLTIIMQKNNSYTLKRVIFGITAFGAMFFAQMAFIAATSEFLSFGLINWLPVLLVLVSLVAIITFGLNVLLSKRLTSLGSLILSIMILAALTVMGFYLKGEESLHFFFALLIARFAVTIFQTSLNNIASSYVNPRQTKRFLPFVRNMMDLAMFMSSLALFAAIGLGVYVDSLWLIVTGSIVTVVGLLIIRRLFEPIAVSAQEDAIGLLGHVKQGTSFVFKKSRLFGLFAWLFVLFGGIIVLFVYVYNNAFAANLNGSNLLLCLAVVNLVAVFLRGVFNVKLLKKMVHKIGTANLLLIYPWVMFLITFVIMFLAENIYLAATLYIFHIFSYYSYVSAATQSMFELVPRKLIQQVFFFIKGVLLSVAALVTSLVMWLALMLCNHNPVIVSFLLFFFVAASLAVSLRIKKEYQVVLLKSVRDPDMVLRSNSVELMGEGVQLEKGEKELRKIVIDETEDVVLRQRAMTSLVEINNPNSIRELLLVVEKDKNGRLRYYAIQAINRMFEHVDKKRFGEMTVTKLLMIDVFNKVYDEDLPLAIKLEVNRALPMFGFDVLLDFYKHHFANSPDYMKASIINALSIQEDRGLISLLEPYLENESLEIRTAAIAGLWRFSELRDDLTSRMVEIFSKKDETHRKAALRLIGQLQLKNMEDYVLDLITVPDPTISTLAVITSINLGRKNGVKVLVRKLSKYSMQNDKAMVEAVFRKLFWLSADSKKRFMNEVRTMSAADFERLQSIYNDSDKYFDLVLADLFTN